MVDLSPWPLVSSFSSLSFLVDIYFYLNSVVDLWVPVLGLISVFVSSVFWWRDVIREGTFQGMHSEEVQTGLAYGMVLFILSEVMFFSCFFFGYFFSSLCPDIQLGCSWPPLGVETLSWSSVPLVNTLILLSSGVSITWSHHSMLENEYKNSFAGLLVTVILGVVFCYFQYVEYYSCSFTMADSVYGSFFFLMTGFHGFHVIVGVMFIASMMIRMMNNHFSKSHHLGYEASAWYWHFVDVVWLFLFITVYWWGS